MTTLDEAVAADLLRAIDGIAEARGLEHDQVVTAMFGCVVSAAVHGGVTRAEFLDLAGRLFEVINERRLS